MTRLQALVLLALAVCIVGCTKNYTILPQAYSRSNSEATEGAVHPYLGDKGRPEQGPFVVVFVASTTDLSWHWQACSYGCRMVLSRHNKQGPAVAGPCSGLRG